MAALTKSARTRHGIEGYAYRLHADDRDSSAQVERDFGAAAVANGVEIADRPDNPVGLMSEVPESSIGIWVPARLAEGFERELTGRHTIVST